MRELNLDEIEVVVGGVCEYAGQNYSTGSVVAMGGGYRECGSSGSWSVFYA